jgi:hypothetical protein
LLLRDDGQAVACGNPCQRQCEVPPLCFESSYTLPARPVVSAAWCQADHRWFPLNRRRFVTLMLLCQKRHDGLASLGDLLTTDVMPFAVAPRICAVGSASI